MKETSIGQIRPAEATRPVSFDADEDSSHPQYDSAARAAAGMPTNNTKHHFGPFQGEAKHCPDAAVLRRVCRYLMRRTTRSRSPLRQYLCKFGIHCVIGQTLFPMFLDMMLSLDVNEQPAFTRYGSLSWADLLSLRMCGILTMPVIETTLHPPPSSNIRIVLPELIRKYEIERQRGGDSSKRKKLAKSIGAFFEERLDSFGSHVLNVVIIVYPSTFLRGQLLLAAVDATDSQTSCFTVIHTRSLEIYEKATARFERLLKALYSDMADSGLSFSGWDQSRHPDASFLRATANGVGFSEVSMSPTCYSLVLIKLVQFASQLTRREDFYHLLSTSWMEKAGFSLKSYAGLVVGNRKGLAFHLRLELATLLVDQYFGGRRSVSRPAHEISMGTEGRMKLDGFPEVLTTDLMDSIWRELDDEASSDDPDSDGMEEDSQSTDDDDSEYLCEEQQQSEDEDELELLAFSQTQLQENRMQQNCTKLSREEWESSGEEGSSDAADMGGLSDGEGWNGDELRYDQSEFGLCSWLSNVAPNDDVEGLITSRRETILQNQDMACTKGLEFTEDIAQQILAQRGSPYPPVTLKPAVQKRLEQSKSRLQTYMLKCILTMMTFTTSKEVQRYRICPRQWLWVIVNSTKSSRNRLLSLFLDFRIRPLDVQYFCGLDQYRIEDLKSLEPLDINHPDRLESVLWSNYCIHVQHPIQSDPYRPDDSLHPEHFLYCGSATNTGEGYGEQHRGDFCVGQKFRIMKGHLPLFQRARKDLIAGRASKNPGILFIHRLGALSRSKITFFCLAKLPVITKDFRVFQHTRLIAYYLEMYHMVALGTLNPQPPSKGLMSENVWSFVGFGKAFSKELAKRLAPDRISPKMPWIGANIVFPITQFIRAVGLRDVIYHSPLQQAVREFESQTQKTYLTKQDYIQIKDQIEQEIGMQLPQTDFNSRIRYHYKVVLKSRGKVWEKRSSHYLRHMFPIWWGLQKYCHMNIFKDTMVPVDENGRIQLNWDAFTPDDWKAIAHLARNFSGTSKDRDHSDGIDNSNKLLDSTESEDVGIVTDLDDLDAFSYTTNFCRNAWYSSKPDSEGGYSYRALLLDNWIAISAYDAMPDKFSLQNYAKEWRSLIAPRVRPMVRAVTCHFLRRKIEAVACSTLDSVKATCKLIIPLAGVQESVKAATEYLTWEPLPSSFNFPETTLGELYSGNSSYSLESTVRRYFRKYYERLARGLVSQGSWDAWSAVPAWDVHREEQIEDRVRQFLDWLENQDKGCSTLGRHSAHSDNLVLSADQDVGWQHLFLIRERTNSSVGMAMDIHHGDIPTQFAQGTPMEDINSVESSDGEFDSLPTTFVLKLMNSSQLPRARYANLPTDDTKKKGHKRQTEGSGNIDPRRKRHKIQADESLEISEQAAVTESQISDSHLRTQQQHKATSGSRIYNSEVESQKQPHNHSDKKTEDTQYALDQPELAETWQLMAYDRLTVPLPQNHGVIELLKQPDQLLNRLSSGEIGYLHSHYSLDRERLLVVVGIASYIRSQELRETKAKNAELLLQDINFICAVIDCNSRGLGGRKKAPRARDALAENIPEYSKQRSIEKMTKIRKMVSQEVLLWLHFNASIRWHEDASKWRRILTSYVEDSEWRSRLENAAIDRSKFRGKAKKRFRKANFTKRKAAAEQICKQFNTRLEQEVRIIRDPAMRLTPRKLTQIWAMWAKSTIEEDAPAKSEDENETNALSCDKCYTTFSNRSTMLRHLKSCAGRCTPCEEADCPCILRTGASFQCVRCREKGLVCNRVSKRTKRV